jgi:hypothetical protein
MLDGILDNDKFNTKDVVQQVRPIIIRPVPVLVPPRRTLWNGLFPGMGLGGAFGGLGAGYGGLY